MRRAAMAGRPFIAALLLLWLGIAHAGEPALAWILEFDGRIIAAKAADRPLPPASLTKVMTALLWLQDPTRVDAGITISRRAAAESGTRARLEAGERYRGRDLLGAMLVASANDACIALAEHAAGSVTAFVADMNRAAEVLGLRETHFSNPCGHDAAGQVSSARDLLRLTEFALANPLFRELVRQPEWRLRAISPAGAEVKILPASNALLGRLDGARGVKTGYTAHAGKSVIALAERDGHQVLLVLLNARDRWRVAHGMVEQAFARGAR